MVHLVNFVEDWPKLISGVAAHSVPQASSDAAVCCETLST